MKLFYIFAQIGSLEIPHIFHGKILQIGVQPGGVVLCIVLFSTPIESYMSYALNRIFDTAIGVIAALLVNYFLPRPRVVSLWEGFKGLFKEDSKV